DRRGPAKSAEALASYASHGSGTVAGVADKEKAQQIAFWDRTAREGLTDEAARKSAAKFRAEFEKLDKKLASAPYLMGEAISVLDIAWFVYAFRLSTAGYPLAKLHPHVEAWYRKLAARPEFAKEVAMSPHAAAEFAKAQTRLSAEGKTLPQVVGL